MPVRRPSGLTLLLAALLVSGAAGLAVVAARGGAPAPTLQDRVRGVASTLRCPVCQNLSVADSPSRLAQEMRATIGRELSAGRTPDQIRSEFVASYGEWILLSPPKRGLDLVAWILPALLLLFALGLGAVMVRRWTSGAGPPASTQPELTAGDRLLLDRALRAAREEAE